MKKYINENQLKKLIKYISLEELKFQEEYWGKVPDTYWESVDMWYNFLKYSFPNNNIDSFILAIILFEMQSYFRLYARLDKPESLTILCRNKIY